MCFFLSSISISDAFQSQGALNFEKNLKKAVDRAHNRVKQKKYKVKIPSKFCGWKLFRAQVYRGVHTSVIFVILNKYSSFVNLLIISYYNLK